MTVVSNDSTELKKASSYRPWAQIGLQKYWLLAIAVMGQLLTVAITWQLWQTRFHPPHLPVFDCHQIPFGLMVLTSLALVLTFPRFGLFVHCLVIAIASLYDQFRLQPQFLALIFLMLATVSEFGQRVCRWFLATLWFWAGVHKLLSPQWFTFASYWLVNAVVDDSNLAEHSYWYFALTIALAEIIVGIAAVFWPRIAAGLCLGMHISIFFLLLIVNWNFSVLPWNAATAVVGTWVMWNAKSVLPLRFPDRPPYGWVEALIAIFLYVFPIGFYWGWVDHGYASVLYSDSIPRALITKHDELEFIQGWAPLHVPFPSERRTLLQYFEVTAEDGEKLHIFDPRHFLSDLFYVKRDGKLQLLDETQFFRKINRDVRGVGYDDRYAQFWLSRWGKITRRWYLERPSNNRHNAIAYAYTADPEHFSPQLLKLLQSLKNLEQLQLNNCPVQDSDMSAIAKLKGLKGIGLNNTSITDAGLIQLSTIPGLRILEIENTQISPAGMKQLKQQLGL